MAIALILRCPAVRMPVSLPKRDRMSQHHWVGDAAAFGARDGHR